MDAKSGRGMILKMLSGVGLLGALLLQTSAATNAWSTVETDVALPLRTSGSVLLPDRVEFAAALKSPGAGATAAKPPIAIAEQVVRLAAPDPNMRAASASAVRDFILKNPDSVPNRQGKSYWEERLAKIRPGMTQDAVIQLLYPNHAWPFPPSKVMRGVWSGQSGTATYRLDGYWTATIYLIKPESPEVSRAPVLNEEVQAVWIVPQKDFTGTWTTYYVNGQKAHEIEYRAGKYDGTFTAFHDDGSKSCEQHYAAGVAHGTDTGWHRNGQKSYEGAYENGKQVGTWRWWDATGKLTSEKALVEPTP